MVSLKWDIAPSGLGTASTTTASGERRCLGPAADKFIVLRQILSNAELAKQYFASRLSIQPYAVCALGC